MARSGRKEPVARTQAANPRGGPFRRIDRAWIPEIEDM